MLIPQKKRVMPWLLAALFACGVLQAQVYKWTDAEGRVHYGDAPQATDDAEPVELRINTYTSVSYEQLGKGVPISAGRVVMYSTSWCGYCKKARRYFQKRGIAFSEYDIETDAAARARYDALGARGVPVILVGSRRMNGFSEQGFEKIYQ